MMSLNLSNRERQSDEIDVISSICDSPEFFSTEDKSECYFNIHPLTEGYINVTYTTSESETIVTNYNKCTIEYLPSVNFVLTLPPDYPSHKPPKYTLVISWLPPWETSKVCQQLDELWCINEGNEILFLWYEFLKNDLLKFLDIKETLDVTFLYNIYTCPEEYINRDQYMNLCHIGDSRAKNYSLFINPVKYLTAQSANKHKLEFEKSFHTCDICFDTQTGQKCIELKNCCHVYCRNCMQEYVATKIKENVVKSICCPRLNCESEIEVYEIKELCPHLFEDYERLLLRVSLNTMSDVVYCPRLKCQSPVLTDPKDNLAICSKCDYSFCILCSKVYHGVALCNSTGDDLTKIIDNYINASSSQKKLLEQKHGKLVLRKLVNEFLTKKYLKENAKPCPKCYTHTCKIGGCNKMVCLHCQTFFCWKCGECIFDKNPYSHYLDKTSKCYKLLFDGNLDLLRGFI